MTIQTFQTLLETKQQNNELTEGFLYFDENEKLFHSGWCCPLENNFGWFSLDRDERPEDLIPVDKVRDFIHQQRDPETTYSEFSVRFELTEEGWLVEVEGDTETEREPGNNLLYGEGVCLGTTLIS